MSTTTELREIFGAELADLVLPHLQGEAIEIVRGLRSLSNAHDAELPEFPLRETLMGFQRSGVAYARKARRAIIGHDMGLGKTIQAIALIQLEHPAPAFVVVPPNLALNWVKEFAKWAPEIKVERLVGTTPSTPAPADVYIIGDSVLTHWQDAIIEMGPAALFIDESQRFKNRSAKRTKAAQAISRKVPANGLVVLLTGTAVKANAGELLSQIQVLGTEDVFGGVFSFLERYYPKVNRYDRENCNLVELFDIMSDTFYARLEFDEVKAQMTERFGATFGDGVTRVPVATELAGKAARDYTRARDDLRNFLIETRGERAASSALRAEALTRLGLLRRLIGMAKVAGTVAHVKNLVEDDEQVIVFAWHRDVVEELAAELGAVKIMGGMKVDEVEANKAAFQAGEVKVIVLNIEAGSVGHTLTAARHVVFNEFAWSPADMAQAEARAYRIGQTRQVISHWMVGTNGVTTIDDRLVDIINEKAVVTGAVLNGRQDETMIDSESVTAALLAWAEEG